MCFEQIYELLKKKGKDGKQSKASQIGGIERAGKTGRNSSAIKAREGEIAEIVSQAESCAKIAGNMPGNMSKLLHDLIYPEKDFASRLLEFAQETLSDEVVWHRPNRRYLPQGVWTPGRENTHQIDNLVVVIDTSGSITLGDMRAYAGAVEQVRDNLDIEKVTVLYCDTQVHEGGEYGIGEQIAFEVQGRGGTDFDPPFKHLEKIGLEPDLMIYFTDLYGSCTVSAPEFPVIWALLQNASRFTPGFGVRIEL
jgi:predicted metal-dependent peptidase